MYRTLTALTVLATAGAASAGDALLLEVDLSVLNQITITATDGASSATASGSEFTGVLLADIVVGDAGSSAIFTGMGDLAPALNTSDMSAQTFISGGTDTGLNIWEMTDGSTNDFEAGMQAFSGSTTWEVSEGMYNALAAPGTFGTIYSGADDSGDIPNATAIGRYVIVPAPGAAALLGLAGVAGVRRRRA
jgi:uncharacterized protein (TIGR03382 family)